jgi:hypothetical protein
MPTIGWTLRRLCFFVREISSGKKIARCLNGNGKARRAIAYIFGRAGRAPVGYRARHQVGVEGNAEDQALPRA